MNNNTVTFIYRNIVIGGIQTLLLRLSDALLKKGYNVNIYYNYIYEKGEEKYLRNGIKMFHYVGKYPKKINDSEGKQLIITFEAEVYINLVINNYRHNKNRDSIFLYSVHPYTFETFYDMCKYNIIKTMFRKGYYKFVKASAEAGYVFFMDEQCLNSTKKEYKINIQFESQEKNILRVIMPIKENFTVCRKNESTFNILTVSRADFPFKGYIKGLIEQYLVLLNEGYKVRLTIVTSGNEIDKIYEWTKGNAGIQIIQNVNYESLSDYYRNADVYIGMGTTILEAAAEGTISIPVSPYTYECNSHGLFSEYPNWVLTEIGEGKPSIEIIRQIIGLSDNERKSISDKMINSVYDLYSTGPVIKRLEEIISNSFDKTYQYKKLPFSYIRFLEVKNIIRKVVKRGK